MKTEQKIQKILTRCLKNGFLNAIHIEEFSKVKLPPFISSTWWITIMVAAVATRIVRQISMYIVSKTASEMHVAPQISQTAPDMPQMMPQTCPRHVPDDAPEMPQKCPR